MDTSKAWAAYLAGYVTAYGLNMVGAEFSFILKRKIEMPPLNWSDGCEQRGQYAISYKLVNLKGTVGL